MLIKIEHGTPVQWPVTEAHLQAENPNTSFAVPIDDATLAEFGYARFHFSDPDAHDPDLQEAKEITPKQIKGKWTQRWEIVEKYTAAEKDEFIAKRDADRLETQKAYVRAERNAKLAASDWTQVADAPVDSSAWAAYRQALRDIKEQEGYPWKIEWPEQPS